LFMLYSFQIYYLDNNFKMCCNKLQNVNAQVTAYDKILTSVIFPPFSLLHPTIRPN